jgi:hypothetical protein
MVFKEFRDVEHEISYFRQTYSTWTIEGVFPILPDKTYERQEL